MKTIIAGSRGITKYSIVCDAVQASRFLITEVVSGGARGVDRLGEEYARKHALPVKQFIPDWNAHGKSAGFKRNVEMAEYAQALIAVWDGESRGTKHMIDIARSKGLNVHVYYLKGVTP